jgi:hypothetical protein
MTRAVSNSNASQAVVPSGAWLERAQMVADHLKYTLDILIETRQLPSSVTYDSLTYQVMQPKVSKTTARTDVTLVVVTPSIPSDGCTTDAQRDALPRHAAGMLKQMYGAGWTAEIAVGKRSADNRFPISIYLRSK